MVDAIMVRHDAALGIHVVELTGKLQALLQKANPAGEAGYVHCASSQVSLVAGVGFEPTTFRL